MVHGLYLQIGWLLELMLLTGFALCAKLLPSKEPSNGFFSAVVVLDKSILPTTRVMDALSKAPEIA